MAGTRAGGLKSAATIRDFDPDFYKKIGAVGGKSNKLPKGFAVNRELAREAGAKGGKVSKRQRTYIDKGGNEHEVT